jgi:hypothetical protein
MVLAPDKRAQDAARRRAEQDGKSVAPATEPEDEATGASPELAPDPEQ